MSLGKAYASRSSIISKPTALLLEDSQTQAAIIISMLREQGWDVFHCLSIPKAIEAFEALKNQTFHALFLDVFVGEQNSLAYLTRFRGLAPHAAIILMTAGSKTEDIQVTLRNARDSRADLVLRKPFTAVQVQAIFTACLTQSQNPARRRHVLIIDDSPFIRSFTRDIYLKAGYRVSLAVTMEDAFDNVDIAHLDLVVCDIFMPGMGGLKGIERLKSVWPQVPVIAISATDDNGKPPEVLIDAQNRGAVAQLGKPFTPEDIMDLTEMILDTSIPI